MAAHLACYGNCTGPFGFPMQEQEARSLDKLLSEHSKDGAVEYKKLVNEKAFKYFIEDERADVSVVTDKSVDKIGEVISPSGVDWSIFKNNPFVSFNHRYDIMPVGKSIWQTRKDSKWLAKTIFADRPKNHPEEKEWEPDTAWHMIKEGFLPAKSIGFLPTKWHEPTKEEKDSDLFLKAAELIWDEVKVYEYAVCTIGMNDNAIVEAVNKGLKMPLALKSLFPFLPEVEKIPDTKQLEITGVSLKDYMDAVRHLVYSKVNAINPADLAEDCIARLTGKV